MVIRSDWVREPGATPIRRVVALALFLLATLSLAACATRPGIETLTPTAATAPGATQVVVLVATDRGPDGIDPTGSASGRAALRFEELTVSVPPGHRSGDIEWTRATAGDPARSFVVTRRRMLDEAAFRRAVAERAVGTAVGVFVHGYNYTLTEALFRTAQLSVDASGVGVPILFSWSSEAAVAGYVADRDAVTYARDDLAQVLDIVGGLETQGPVLLAGHSMGGWLVMETLRQLRLEGRDRLIDRFEVALAAPDIDVDVFRRQLAVVGPLDPPLTVLVAKDDRALAISRRLAGGRQRVGSVDVNDPRLAQVARQVDVRIVDISSVEASDGTRHDRFVRFAALQSRAMATEAGPLGAIGQAGAYVFNAAGAVVASPFTLAGEALGAP